MLKKLKLLVISATLVTAGLSVVAAPKAAALFENAQKEACDSLNVTNGAPVAGQEENACGTTNGERVQNVIRLVLNLLSLVVGVAAVIMIVISGLKFILSAGDSGDIASARTTLLYAVVGLVVAVSAQLILRFVVKKTTTPPPKGTITNQQDELPDQDFSKPGAGN